MKKYSNTVWTIFLLYVLILLFSVHSLVIFIAGLAMLSIPVGLRNMLIVDFKNRTKWFNVVMTIVDILLLATIIWINIK
ncbi:hypothetical protein AKUH3B101J_00990 [Apilactobacillus kunkeei]|uniref:Uncharacterized protein n=1 Tax=Apilactobacillus kunkeei DSM 12361 = ATCC 700308 TaxID=1423768 RepID=A0A0R1FR15_9LACO|nr:hypothetical protein [Apilactobacillus kunkeei]KRK24341.1 hypothetical protein FD43_GL001153 [Apilactobacillus kunkeei DSM 12361 = ATCC 700308]MCK8620276.1 hypothetical protein [Apilactobacillus kunkeei]MCK8626649.1 hypothetical protein [Apilactobacillus kunkeei]MCK8634382.1 hypothetical protein [Apilactobacillus kunkeei]MCK8635969.1 hypothetical protein [Apilactobacillus kunkeei]